MKVLFLNTVLKLILIPRNYPLIGDVLTMSLRDEFSDDIISPPVTFEKVGKRLEVTITTQPTEFSIQRKYEITLKNGSKVIYLGKCMILEQGTDIQNYEYNTQPNARFDYK